MNIMISSINAISSLSDQDFALLLKQEIQRQMELQKSLLGIHTRDLQDIEGVLADRFDNATIEEIRNRAFRLSEAEHNRYKKLETALRRLEIATERSYWNVFICSCGNNIDRKRLMAQPTTTLCCDCKSQQEESERRVHGYAPGRHMWHHNP